MNIVHQPVEIVLREDLYGCVPFDYSQPVYGFYFLDGGKIDLICIRSEDVLIAVTKQQQKSWQGRKIIRIPRMVEFVKSGKIDVIEWDKNWRDKKTPEELAIIDSQPPWKRIEDDLKAAGWNKV